MKKHKFKILTFVAVAAALAGTGCFKSIGYETFYVLRPWAQEGTVKTPIPREDMLAYAFDELDSPVVGAALCVLSESAGVDITAPGVAENLMKEKMGEAHVDG